MWDQWKYDEDLAIFRASTREIADAMKKLVTDRDEWKKRAETAEFKLNKVLPSYIAQCAKLLEDNDALSQRAEAAEAAALQLRLDLGSAVERSNRLAIWTDRYGADQWRRGNAGKDPQGFSEWQKEAQP